MEVKDILKGKVVIVGVGNAMKGDDGLGSALVGKIKGKVDAVCIDAGTAPENYVGKIAEEKPDTVLLVDAAHLDGKPGQYEILESDNILKSGFTTHDISPKLFMEYLNSRTKAQIYMLGIQPENVSFGEGMSESVKNTVERLSQIILDINKCMKHI